MSKAASSYLFIFFQPVARSAHSVVHKAPLYFFLSLELNLARFTSDPEGSMPRTPHRQTHSQTPAGAHRRVQRLCHKRPETKNETVGTAAAGRKLGRRHLSHFCWLRMRRWQETSLRSNHCALSALLCPSERLPPNHQADFFL